MPTENRSTTTSIPPVIGETPLVGSYYAVECTRCGWVGSSEEITDDCQCTQPDGDHTCLGDTDEIGPEQLLGIVQAMAKQAQHQGEPVVLPMPKLVSEYNNHDWDEGYRDGWGACRNEIAKLGPLYTHADSSEVDQLRLEVEKLRLDLTMLDAADIQEDCVRIENTALRAQLAERDALLTWWKNHLGVHLSILFGTSGHTPEEADKSADDIIRRAERLAPQSSTSTEPNTPVCDHDFTDDGQHLLVCTACGYTEDHDPKWRPIETAPTDGTLVRLLVEFEENSTEDDQQAPTIGHNSFKDTGEDEWQFAGWNWQQDCYTSGQGKPVGWLPLLDAPAIKQSGPEVSP